MKRLGKTGKRIIIVLIAVLLLSLSVFLMWYEGLFLPRWTKWNNKSETIDGVEFLLKNRRLKAFAGDTLAWDLTDRVKVQDFFTADVDRDGETEIIVLCWKIGRYGKYIPMNVKKDTKEFTQHIYVYNLRAGKVVPKWMASDIGCDVTYLESTDGVKLTLHHPDGTESLWRWNGWGFTRID